MLEHNLNSIDLCKKQLPLCFISARKQKLLAFYGLDIALPFVVGFAQRQ
jgi:hypothetical protein